MKPCTVMDPLAYHWVTILLKSLALTVPCISIMAGCPVMPRYIHLSSSKLI